MTETQTTPQSEPPPETLAGLLAQFADPPALVAAAARVRRSGYTRWDCYSPFPVHGIDRAMGIRRTRLPWLVLGAGFAGAAAALLMQWWMNAVDYPVIISGKPLFSLPANIPITFELIVLFSALTAFGGALVLNRLPQFTHPVLGAARFRRVTTDGLFLAIESADPRFEATVTREFLQSLGAVAVEECYEPAAGRAFPKLLPWLGVAFLVTALLPPLLIARARSVKSEVPRIHPIQDMAFQPKYKSQATSPLFADGRAARPPVPGTIADGPLRTNEHLESGKKHGQWATDFPLPVTEAAMRRGQEQFAVFCATCHGLVGLGDGMISQRAFQRGEPKWIRPSSLQDAAIRQQPVGQLFGTITNGVRKMPAYGAQISVEDRWKIVLYVRALERSQNATLDDVPPELRDRLK